MDIQGPITRNRVAESKATNSKGAFKCARSVFEHDACLWMLAKSVCIHGAFMCSVHVSLVHLSPLLPHTSPWIRNIPLVHTKWLKITHMSTRDFSHVFTPYKAAHFPLHLQFMPFVTHIPSETYKGIPF